MNDTLKRIPPQDLREIMSLLQWMKNELEDTFTVALDELLPLYYEQVRDWKNGGPEPCWQDFRDSINDECREHAYPELFPAPTPPEPQPDDACPRCHHPRQEHRFAPGGAPGQELALGCHHFDTHNDLCPCGYGPDF